MAEFGNLCLENAIHVFSERKKLVYELKKLPEDTLSALYRAFFGLVNFNSEKSRILEELKHECKNIGVSYSEVKSIFSRMWGTDGECKYKLSFDHRGLDSEVTVESKAFPEGEMTVMIKSAPSGLDEDEEKEAMRDRVALSIYEQSFYRRNGMFWSFTKAFLKPYFDKIDCKIEAFCMSEDAGLLPTRMTLYSVLDNRPRNIGNFFTSNLPPSSYYVNPPYSEFLLKKAAERADHYLRKKQKYKFLFIVPDWKDAEFYQFLLYNKRVTYYTTYDRFQVWNAGKTFWVKKGLAIFILEN